MDVAFLILTDHSESVNGKLYANGAGWNQLRFPELPQNYVIGIALGIDIPWDETNQPASISIEVEDPDGSTLGDDLEIQVEAGRPPGLPTGQEQRVVMSMGSGVSLETQGPHAVIVRSGERELARARFYVAVVPMPGGAPPD